MIYLFLDCDEYLLSQRIGKFRDALGDPEITDLNVITVEGAKASAADILGHAAMVPFLAARRLIVAEGYLLHLDRRMAASGSTDSAAHAEASELLQGIEHVPKSSDLVFVDSGVDKRRALWKGFRIASSGSDQERRIAGLDALTKEGTITLESWGTPDSRALPGWIQTRAKARGVSVEMQAVGLLADYVGPNLRQLDNELQKLAAYAQDRAVTADDVRLLVSDAGEAMIWDLTDAVSQRNPKQAATALHALRRGDANAFYLLTMIARQYRIILKVKEAMAGRIPKNEREIAKVVGERPFPVRKAMGQANAYSMTMLEAIMSRVLETDFAMKTGADPDTELDVLIAELTQRPESVLRHQ